MVIKAKPTYIISDLVYHMKTPSYLVKAYLTAVLIATSASKLFEASFHKFLTTASFFGTDGFNIVRRLPGIQKGDVCL